MLLRLFVCFCFADAFFFFLCSRVVGREFNSPIGRAIRESLKLITPNHLHLSSKNQAPTNKNPAKQTERNKAIKSLTMDTTNRSRLTLMSPPSLRQFDNVVIIPEDSPTLLRPLTWFCRNGSSSVPPTESTKVFFRILIKEGLNGTPQDLLPSQLSSERSMYNVTIENRHHGAEVTLVTLRENEAMPLGMREKFLSDDRYRLLDQNRYYYQLIVGLGGSGVTFGTDWFCRSLLSSSTTTVNISPIKVEKTKQSVSLASSRGSSSTVAVEKGRVDGTGQLTYETRRQALQEEQRQVLRNDENNAAVVVKNDNGRLVHVEQPPLIQPMYSNDADEKTSGNNRSLSARLVYNKSTRQFSIELLGYTNESNRVVRMFPDKLFLSVAGDNTYFSKMEEADEIEYIKQLRNFLSDGIKQFDINLTKLNGVSNGIKRKRNTVRFQFLAYSNSALKSGSFWCVETKEDVENMFAQLGNFAKAKQQGATKLAKRIGQNFGTTTQSIVIHPHEWTVVRDIEKAHNTRKFTFTDGVGFMTETKAREIRRLLNLPGSTHVFQVRFVGFKGVLVAYPDESPIIRRLRNGAEGLHFFFRSSMDKFGFDTKASYSLDITGNNNIPDGIPGALNRQFIMGLCALGVQTETILHSFQQVLQLYDQPPQKPKVALQLLKSKTDYKNKILQTVLNACKRPDLQDPFIHRMVNAAQTKRLENLCMAQKMKLPLTESRYVIGIADESQTLKADEVYLSLDSIDLHNRKVVVTRNPAMHPGDFRIFTVNNRIEALSHIQGAIAFSTDLKSNDVPAPHMMGGGDLDGDLYFVCWHPNFVDFQCAPRGEYEIGENASNQPVPDTKRTTEVLIDTFIRRLENPIGKLEHRVASLYEHFNGNIMKEEYKRAAVQCALAIDGLSSDELKMRVPPPVWHSSRSCIVDIKSHLVKKKQDLQEKTRDPQSLTIISHMVYEACKLYCKKIEETEGVSERFISQECRAKFIKDGTSCKLTVETTVEHYSGWLAELEKAIADSGFDIMGGATSRKRDDAIDSTSFEERVTAIKKQIQEAISGDVTPYERSYDYKYHNAVLKFYEHCYDRASEEEDEDKRTTLLAAPWLLFYDVLTYVKKKHGPYSKECNIFY